MSHQDPETGYCDHLQTAEADGYTYAYCMCCDKCLGLSSYEINELTSKSKVVSLRG